MRKKHDNRSGFTLLELLLSLALIVLATALIGFLMQMYARNFATRGDDVRRLQLARGILNMMAEDIRSVVLEQEYDASVLETQLGAGGEGQGGEGDAAQGGSGLASEQAPSSGLGNMGFDDSAAGSEEDLSESIAAYPPGIYGDQFTLMVDVSRLPRADEYQVQQTSLIDGTLADVPGDIKTVTYYVQSSTNQGVADDVEIFGSSTSGASPVDWCGGRLTEPWPPMRRNSETPTAWREPATWWLRR